MPYRVEFSPAAKRAFRRLPAQAQDTLEAVIMDLAKEPHPPGVRKIKGSVRACRMRSGDYRVVYEIYEDAKLVVVVWVGRRTETTYRRV